MECRSGGASPQCAPSPRARGRAIGLPPGLITSSSQRAHAVYDSTLETSNRYQELIDHMASDVDFLASFGE